MISASGTSESGRTVQCGPYPNPKATASTTAGMSPSTARAASRPAASSEGRAGDRCACSSVPPLTSSAMPPLPCSAAVAATT